MAVVTNVTKARPQREPLVGPGEIDLHASDMGVIASAEVTLGEVDAALAKASPVPQWLGIDGDPSQTLAQLIQYDSTGPLRLGYGGWRDRLSGVQFRDGRGDLVTVGGLPVKNVAGYDLVKLMVGSHGCFGELVTVTCRTGRRPTHAMTATLAGEAEPISVTVNRLLTCDAPPQWVLLTPRGLQIGWHGSESQIFSLQNDATAAAGAHQVRSFDEDTVDRKKALDVASPEHGHLRLAVPPARVAEVVAALGTDRYAADPVFGIVWADGRSLEQALGLANRFAGSMLAFGADATSPRVTTYGIMEQTASLLRGLKAKLDPDNRLPALPVENKSS